MSTAYCQFKVGFALEGYSWWIINIMDLYVHPELGPVADVDRDQYSFEEYSTTFGVTEHGKLSNRRENVITPVALWYVFNKIFESKPQDHEGPCVKFLSIENYPEQIQKIILEYNKKYPYDFVFY